VDLLCYLPKPSPYESPKSILLRMAHYNGYKSARNMCNRLFGAPHHWIDLLDQNSPILGLINSQSPTLADLLRKNFYKVHNRSIRFDNLNIGLGANTKLFAYCPACIREEQHLVLHDIPHVEICALHSLLLITECPRCRNKEFWQDARLLQCKCGFERINAMSTPRAFTPKDLDSPATQNTIEKLSLQYEISRLCADIWDSRRTNEQTGYCSLPLQVISHIEHIARSNKKLLSNQSSSDEMDLWLNHGSPIVAWLAARALERGYSMQNMRPPPLSKECPPSRQGANDHICVPEENSVCLPGNQTTEQCKVVVPTLSSSDPKHTPAQSRVDTQSNTSHCTGYQYGLTEDEVAALLSCKVSTVASLRSQGWVRRVNINSPIQSFMLTILDQESCIQFSTRYILIDEACTLLGVSSQLCEFIFLAAGLFTSNACSSPLFYERKAVYALFSRLESKKIIPIV